MSTVVTVLGAEASRHATKMLQDDFGEVLLDLNSVATRPAESLQTIQASIRYEEFVALHVEG